MSLFNLSKVTTSSEILHEVVAEKNPDERTDRAQNNNGIDSRNLISVKFNYHRKSCKIGLVMQENCHFVANSRNLIPAKNVIG